MKFPKHTIPTPLEFAGFCLMVVLAAILWPVKAKADYTQAGADAAKAEALCWEDNVEPAYIDVRNMGIALFDEIEGQNNLGWQLWQAYLNGSIDASTYNAGVNYFNDAKNEYQPYKNTASTGQSEYDNGVNAIDDGDSYYDQQNWEYAISWYEWASMEFHLADQNLGSVRPHWHNAETYINYCYYIIYFGTVPPPPPPGP